MARTECTLIGQCVASKSRSHGHYRLLSSFLPDYHCYTLEVLFKGLGP